MKQGIVSFLTRRPWLWILGIGLLTAFFSWAALGLTIREELLDYWDEDNAQLVFLEETLDRFGLEGGAVLGIQFDTPVFSRKNLERIRHWTDILASLDGVTETVSLTSVSTVKGSEDGIDVSALVPDPLPKSEAAYADMARRAGQDPQIAGRLLSEDGTATAILLSYPDKLVYADELVIGEGLWKTVLSEEKKHPDLSLHPTGVPAFLSVFRALTFRELKVLYPAVVLCMILILWVSFRNVRAVLVPLAVITIASIWTLGTIRLCGSYLTSATIVVPAVVVVISVADTIHIINQYFESVRRAGPGIGLEDRLPLMRATLDRVLFPCFLTTVTTLAGFLSLLLVDVPLIQDMGLFVSMGILSAFLVSVTLVPACYLLGPLPTSGSTSIQVSGWVGRFLAGVTSVVLRRPLAVGLISTAVVLFGMAGLRNLQVDFHWKEFVKKGHRIREAIRFLDSRLGGYDWLTVVVEIPEKKDGDLLDPEKLSAILEIQQLMEQETFVGHVNSVVAPLRLSNRIFHGGDPSYDTVPASRELAAQYMLLFDLGAPGSLDGLISYDRRVAQVSANLVSPGHRAVRTWLERLRPEVEAIGRRAGFHATISGFSAIFSQLNMTITSGLIWSLSGAVLIISIILTLALRNLRLGLAAMIPNLIPVLVTLGFMGWIGLDLSGQTAIIGCIGIGIAVDDTIHFLHRFHRELRQNGGDRRRAVEATILSTGRAITFTSVVLLAGFCVLLLSAFVQYTLFGLLTAVTMCSALLGDLFLLPVMLIGFPWLTAENRGTGATLQA
jgi:predicted RND superfamily exporter protein